MLIFTYVLYYFSPNSTQIITLVSQSINLMLLYFHLYCTEVLENGPVGQKRIRGKMKAVGQSQ